jgi:hypothetical protein
MHIALFLFAEAVLKIIFIKTAVCRFNENNSCLKTEHFRRFLQCFQNIAHSPDYADLHRTGDAVDVQACLAKHQIAALFFQPPQQFQYG